MKLEFSQTLGYFHRLEVADQVIPVLDCIAVLDAGRDMVKTRRSDRNAPNGRFASAGDYPGGTLLLA